MGRKRHPVPQRGNAIITRISIDALNTTIHVDRGKTLIGWKSGFRNLLQRESQRLQRIAAINMALKSETNPISGEVIPVVQDTESVFIQDSARLTTELHGEDKDDFWTLEIWDWE
jgi:hypothetical protein